MRKKSKKSHPHKSNPTSQADQQQSQQQVVLQQKVVSGPIPDPSTLERYNHLLPGSAERILKMAEDDARHRRESEATVLTAQIEADKRKHSEIVRGQKFGLVATLSAFSLAAFAIIRDYPVVAGTICSVTIVALTTVFITGRKSK